MTQLVYRVEHRSTGLGPWSTGERGVECRNSRPHHMDWIDNRIQHDLNSWPGPRQSYDTPLYHEYVAARDREQHYSILYACSTIHELHEWFFIMLPELKALNYRLVTWATPQLPPASTRSASTAMSHSGSKSSPWTR